MNRTRTIKWTFCAAMLVLCGIGHTAANDGLQDSRTLPRLMKDRGFAPPKHFKAAVFAFTFNRQRTTITKEKRYIYNPSAFTAATWNAASTVKLYPAIAAVQYIRELGFSPGATLTFHGASETRVRLVDLIQSALTPSDNLAYNRLIQFVGFDRMNEQFLSKQNDFSHTALSRAYGGGAWTRLGESRSLRVSPPITVSEGTRKTRLPSRTGTYKTACSGTCTSIKELSMTLRKLMLQEQLRPAETFRLKTPDLILIRKALRADRKRGEEALHALRGVFRDPSMRFYHKGGFFPEWYSDNIYVHAPRNRKAWIITLAADAGRDGLNEAARIIGGLIRDDVL